MDRLHVRARLLGYAAFGLLTLPSCGDRQIDSPDDDELRGRPLCMVAAGTRGYYSDGTSRHISDINHSMTPRGCMCINEDAAHDPAVHDQLNDLTYEACVEVANTQFDFEWDECLQDYESGTWTVIRWGDTEDGVALPPGFSCD